MAKKQSKGLGDTIENAIPKTVKKIVKKVFKDCGCNERKEWANKMVPYPFFNTVKNCMTKEQHEAFKDYKKRAPKVLEETDQNMIHSMYNSVFAVNMKPCVSCNGAVWRGYIMRLEKVYENYK